MAPHKSRLNHDLEYLHPSVWSTDLPISVLATRGEGSMQKLWCYALLVELHHGCTAGLLAGRRKRGVSSRGLRSIVSVTGVVINSSVSLKPLALVVWRFCDAGIVVVFPLALSTDDSCHRIAKIRARQGKRPPSWYTGGGVRPELMQAVPSLGVAGPWAD